MKSRNLKGGDLAETAYTATATFGRVVAFFQMLVGIVIGIILIVIGIALFKSKPDPQQAKKSNNTFGGIVFILLGLLVAIGSIVWFYLTLTYKPIAAATGAVTGVSWAANAVID